jgi:hypothetical protein
MPANALIDGVFGELELVRLELSAEVIYQRHVRLTALSDLSLSPPVDYIVLLCEELYTPNFGCG